MSACPSGKKRSFTTKAEAKRFLRYAKRSVAVNGRLRHVYLCQLCGFWHMTTQRSDNSGGKKGIGKCRACPASILWCRMPSGKPNPLDVETVPCEERKGPAREGFRRTVKS